MRSHENWPATIARYQTVVDTYPQYSHMDDVLIGIGDAYEAEAAMVRSDVICSTNLAPGTRCLPEGAKARLLSRSMTARQPHAYRRVVL